MAQAAQGHILVVDDETAITDLVSMALRYEGFTITVANDGITALELARADTPDLVVLDVMLPDLDGLTILRKLRAESMVPVVFLTARASLDDRLTGLTIGADDYLVKPFAVAELVARVNAVLRRVQPPTSDGDAITYADLRLDETRHEVERDGAVIELTPTEFNLLRYLLINAGRVVSKAQILDNVWRYDFGGNDNVVEAYISYLRKKIDKDREPLIHTVRGVGYSLRNPRSGR